MRASITGDSAALERLVAGVGRLATPGFRNRALDAAARTMADLVRAEFQVSTGPRGVRWKRLKQPRERGRPNKGGPLFDDGKLREQASTVQVTGEGLLVFVHHPGALVHLYGSAGRGGGRDARGRFTSHGRVPARPYLPLRVLPQTWARGLNGAATGVMRREVT